MFWWFLLGIFVLILILPLGASLLYDAEGFRVRVIAGPIRFTVFPMKQKKEKPKQQSGPEKPAEEKPEHAAAESAPPKQALPEAPKPPPKPEEKAEKKEPAGGSITDFLPLVELALKFVGEFFHKTLHIDALYLKLTMAGDDPADLAINYGRTWAALGNLWPYIDRMFTIKKRDVQVQCDFTASETLVNARVDITLTLARILGLVISYGVRILVKFLKITNKRKNAAEAGKNENNTQTNEGGAIK